MVKRSPARLHTLRPAIQFASVLNSSGITTRPGQPFSMSKRVVLAALLVLSLTANASLLLRLRSAPARVLAGRTSAAEIPMEHVGGGARLAPSAADKATAEPGASPAADRAGAGTWSQFSTRDPAVLVARMRAAGFSTAATRGAVYALLRELQEEERAAALARIPVEPYWKTVRDPVSSFAQNRELSRLWQERDRIMRQLFPEEQAAFLLRHQARFGSLPEDKLMRLVALEQDYNDMQIRIQMQGAGSPRMPWTQDELALLEQERRKDLAALLSPAELEEFDLRASPTAQSLQRQLAAFDPTESEYRGIYALRAEFDARYRSMTEMSPATMAARREAQQQLDRAIESLLGAERYAQYAQSIDSGYQAGFQVARRLGLDPAVAASAFEIQREIVQRSTAIRTDRARTAEERTAALAALIEDANRRLGGVLTPSGLAEYRIAAPWLRSLEMQANPRPRP